MARLWAIKPSPGKGTGMFTTQDVPAGTHILHDPGVAFEGCDDPTTSYKEQQRRILRAVRYLKRSDRAKFYSLHEGTRQHDSREMRIFKANAFRDDDGEGGDGGGNCHIYFDIARINHSCLPNAEVGEDGVHAIRDLAQDEEIFISYVTYLDGWTRSQRQKAMRVQYGFECSCPCCSETNEHLVRLSDARRRIIDALFYILQGAVPPTPEEIETLVAPAGEAAPAITPAALLKPLSVQQLTAYRFLDAALRRAEGLGGVRVALGFQYAATLLLEQFNEEPRPEYVPVCATYQIIQTWIALAHEAWIRARGDKQGEGRVEFENV